MSLSGTGVEVMQGHFLIAVAVAVHGSPKYCYLSLVGAHLLSLMPDAYFQLLGSLA